MVNRARTEVTKCLTDYKKNRIGCFFIEHPAQPRSSIRDGPGKTLIKVDFKFYDMKDHQNSCTKLR